MCNRFNTRLQIGIHSSILVCSESAALFLNYSLTHRADMRLLFAYANEMCGVCMWLRACVRFPFYVCASVQKDGADRREGIQYVQASLNGPLTPQLKQGSFSNTAI